MDSQKQDRRFREEMKKKHEREFWAVYQYVTLYRRFCAMKVMDVKKLKIGNLEKTGLREVMNVSNSTMTILSSTTVHVFTPNIRVQGGMKVTRICGHCDGVLSE